MFSEAMLIQIAENGDFITGDRVLEHASSLEDVEYFKIDYLFKSGTWRSEEFSIYEKNKFNGKTVVIGHSDIEFDYKAWLVFKLLKVRNVLALNLGVSRKNHYALPLGVPEWMLTSRNEPTSENMIFRALHDISHDQSKIYYMYSNFSDSTYSSLRVPLTKLIQKIPKIKKGMLDSSESGRYRYLTEIRKSHMVLCPRGNGIDTFRFWESLYLGSVPVVVEKDLPKGILDFDLPIVVLRNWEEITDTHLVQRKYDQCRSIQNKCDNLSFTFLKTYINQIILS
jgi:hypothetical protein